MRKKSVEIRNPTLKLSDLKLEKSSGLGGTLIVATTDGITDKERDNVGGGFAKLVVPATKALPMEITSALFMGSVQIYSADGLLSALMY